MIISFQQQWHAFFKDLQNFLIFFSSGNVRSTREEIVEFSGPQVFIVWLQRDQVRYPALAAGDTQNSVPRFLSCLTCPPRNPHPLLLVPKKPLGWFHSHPLPSPSFVISVSPPQRIQFSTTFIFYCCLVIVILGWPEILYVDQAVPELIEALPLVLERRVNINL